MSILVTGRAGELRSSWRIIHLWFGVLILYNNFNWLLDDWPALSIIYFKGKQSQSAIVTTGRFFLLLCLFSDRRANTFLESSLVTAKMDVQTDAKERSAGTWTTDSWPAAMQSYIHQTSTQQSRGRAGVDHPLHQWWGGLADLTISVKTRILQSLSPRKAKGKQASFLLRFGLFGV